MFLGIYRFQSAKLAFFNEKPFNLTSSNSTYFQPLVQITDGFYSVILPSSSNGMPALPEPSSAPTSSMLISPPSSEPVALASIISATSAPIPLVSTTAPADPTTTEQASTSAASAPSGETGVTTTPAPTTARRPTARKNNKRKASLTERIINGGVKCKNVHYKQIKMWYIIL